MRTSRDVRSFTTFPIKPAADLGEWRAQPGDNCSLSLKRVPLHLITAASSATYYSCTLKAFAVFLLKCHGCHYYYYSGLSRIQSRCRLHASSTFLARCSQLAVQDGSSIQHINMWVFNQKLQRTDSSPQCPGQLPEQHRHVLMCVWLAKSWHSWQVRVKQGPKDQVVKYKSVEKGWMVVAGCRAAANTTKLSTWKFPNYQV